MIMRGVTMILILGSIEKLFAILWKKRNAVDSGRKLLYHVDHRVNACTGGTVLRNVELSACP